MRRRVAWIVAGAALGVVAALHLAPTQATAQPTPQVLQQARSAVQRALLAPWKKIEAARGAGTAVARPDSKTVWVSRMNVPGQSNDGEAGFELPPVTVGGTVTGARVKASFNLESYAGPVLLHLKVYPPGGAAPVATVQGGGSTVTSNPEIITPPFTMEKDKAYKAYATVHASGGGSEMVVWAVATVVEVKWEF